MISWGERPKQDPAYLRTPTLWRIALGIKWYDGLPWATHTADANLQV